MRKPFNCSSESRVKGIISAIATHVWTLQSPRKGCYLYVMGGHQKRDFQSIHGSTSGVTLMWSGSILPLVARPLSGIIPSYAGLICIVNQDKLLELFCKFAESSMIGIYCFDPTLEARFAEGVKSNLSLDKMDLVVEADPRFIIYIVDCNNPSSKTGFFDFLSIGPQNPVSFARELEHIA